MVDVLSPFQHSTKGLYSRVSHRPGADEDAFGFERLRGPQFGTGLALIRLGRETDDVQRRVI